MDELKWYEKPLRISAVQCNYGEDSFDILENHVFKGGFNTEQLLHLNAVGHTSFYNHKRDSEKLKKYIIEAKKRNIRIILYWNVHCVEQLERDMNPDWIQLDENKEDVKAYSDKYLICTNSPWAEEFMENLEEVLKLDIDGIFLDGPSIYSQGCHCRACQEMFKKIYGKSIFNAAYKEMLEFKVKTTTDYVKKTYQMKEKINHNILIYLNNSSLRADVTGSSTDEVEPYVDMLGTEAGFAYIRKRYSFTHMAPHIKYIETKAKGKPYVIFTAGDNKPHSYYMHTAPETKILYYRSIAHGANIWYGIHAPTYIMKSPGGQAAYECNRFHEKYSDYYLKTTSKNKIAIVWSQDTANYYSSSIAESDFTKSQKIGEDFKKGDHSKSFYGFCDVLVRNHMQFDVIDEQILIDDCINKYNLIIFPVCACMSDKVLESVKEYVKNGGRIIASYETGMYNEKGLRLDAGRLTDLFGIKGINNIYTYEGGTSYLKVGEKYASSLNSDVIPGPFKVLDCEMNGSAKPVVKICRPMAGRYVDFPKMELDFITENKYGKGACIYCSGNIGELIDLKGYSDNITLMGQIILNNSNTIITTNAPQSVEIIVRYQKMYDRYLIHLVNMTGEMSRPIERLIPINNIEVSFNIDKDIKNIYVLNNAFNIKTGEENNTVTIDCLRDYGVLVLE